MWALSVEKPKLFLQLENQQPTAYKWFYHLKCTTCLPIPLLQLTPTHTHTHNYTTVMTHSSTNLHFLPKQSNTWLISDVDGDYNRTTHTTHRSLHTTHYTPSLTRHCLPCSSFKSSMYISCHYRTWIKYVLLFFLYFEKYFLLLIVFRLSISLFIYVLNVKTLTWCSYIVGNELDAFESSPFCNKMSFVFFFFFH